MIVPAFTSNIGERNTFFGPFHKDCILRVRQYARGTFAVPPSHQLISEPLLVQDGDLKHGRHVAQQNGQERARRRYHGRPIRT
jgi:hypothetical protein